MKSEPYETFMWVAYVICMKLLCYFYHLIHKQIYAFLYPEHNNNASMDYYFLPNSYERDNVLNVF